MKRWQPVFPGHGFFEGCGNPQQQRFFPESGNELDAQPNLKSELTTAPSISSSPEPVPTSDVTTEPSSESTDNAPGEAMDEAETEPLAETADDPLPDANGGGVMVDGVDAEGNIQAENLSVDNGLPTNDDASSNGSQESATQTGTLKPATETPQA